MMELKVSTPDRIALVDITERVNKALAGSPTNEGLCNLFTSHTTAALIISENWDPDVTTDLLRHLEKLVPHEAGYRHSEGNSQAHILSAIHGVSLNVPIRSGKLALGRWQGVMLAEFDGPRERSVVLTVLGAG
jgi:secondary thiamine-phosphate synthase enzyme